MKKQILLLITLVTFGYAKASQGIGFQTSPAVGVGRQAGTQQPPADVQSLLVQHAQAIEDLIAQVKSTGNTEAKNLVQQIDAVRQQLDAQMKQARAQGVQVNQGSTPPTAVQQLITKNGKLLEQLFEVAKNSQSSELKSKVARIEAISKQLQAKMKQYEPKDSTPAVEGKRARRIE